MRKEELEKIFKLTFFTRKIITDFSLKPDTSIRCTYDADKEYYERKKLKKKSAKQRTK